MFSETGSVKAFSKSGRRKTAAFEYKSLDVCILVEDDPHLTTRQISRKFEISQKKYIMKNVKFIVFAKKKHTKHNKKVQI